MHWFNIDAYQCSRWWVSSMIWTRFASYFFGPAWKLQSKERNLSRVDQTESEQENKTFVAPYDESIALEICQILLKHGASANGNTIYEMRPLHIAIRREWLQVARVLLEAGRLSNRISTILFLSLRCKSKYCWKRYLCFSTDGHRCT